MHGQQYIKKKLIRSVRTDEYINLNALALDIPVTRHQVLLHFAGFLITVEIYFP